MLRQLSNLQFAIRDMLGIESCQSVHVLCKMLEYLHKEVFLLRSQNTQLRTYFDWLKENNQRLMDANASASPSFAALNQRTKQLTKQDECQTHGGSFEHQVSAAKNKYCRCRSKGGAQNEAGKLCC